MTEMEIKMKKKNKTKNLCFLQTKFMSSNIFFHGSEIFSYPHKEVNKPENIHV